MSDEFEVPIKSVSQLSPSVLVENMSDEMSETSKTPVLFGNSVRHVHDVEGGYDHDSGQQVVTLFHRVQGEGTRPDSPTSPSVEVHTSESFYTLSVEDRDEWRPDYPQEDYALTLYVSGYQRGPYTFRDELLASIDKRETEFSYEFEVGERLDNHTEHTNE